MFSLSSFTALIGAFLATMCLNRTFCWSCGTSHVMYTLTWGRGVRCPSVGSRHTMNHHLNSAIGKQALQSLMSMPRSIGRLTFGSGSQGTQSTSRYSLGIRQRRIMLHIEESEDETRLPAHCPPPVSYIRLINTYSCIYHLLTCLLSMFSLLLTSLTTNC